MNVKGINLTSLSLSILSIKLIKILFGLTISIVVIFFIFSFSVLATTETDSTSSISAVQNVSQNVSTSSIIVSTTTNSNFTSAIPTINNIVSAEIPATTTLISNNNVSTTSNSVKTEIISENKVVNISTTTNATSSEEVVEEKEKIEEQEKDQDEDETVDLGDNHSETDAKKDMTGVVRQSQDYYCGPASLATLRTQLGDDTTEKEVLDLINPEDLNSEKGTHLLALKIAAKKLGSNVYLKKWSAEQVLNYIKETQDPVLIHDEKKGVGGHFSVIRSYDLKTGQVELSDTEAGNIKYSIEDFKHIYQNSVFIIAENSENATLLDISTDINDEEAKNIWGKYVPVVMAAYNMGKQKQVNEFVACTKLAFQYSDRNQRNTERAKCYTNLGKSLSPDLNFLEEVKLSIKVDTDDLKDKTHEKIIGTNDTLKFLDFIINLQTEYKNLIPPSENIIYDEALYNKLKIQFEKLDKKLIPIQIDKDLLESAVKSKQLSTDNLQTEINSGSFIQNGQKFNLGAVGSQISATVSNYDKLSASLNKRFENLNGQIDQAEKSFKNAKSYFDSNNNNVSNYSSLANSAFSNYQNHNNQANTYSANANSAYANYKSSLSRRQYINASQNLINYYSYNYQASQARNTANTFQKQSSDYKLQSSNAVNSANYWKGQMSNFEKQIQALKSQRDGIAKEKDQGLQQAKAEQARLQRLKSAGEAEMQRKKNLLATLDSELNKLKDQFTNKQNQFTQYSDQINPLRSQIELQEKAKTFLAQKLKITNHIDLLRKRSGFITITYNNIEETERLKKEEVELVRKWDREAELLATKESRELIDKGINKFLLINKNIFSNSNLEDKAIFYFQNSIPKTGEKTKVSLIIVNAKEVFNNSSILKDCVNQLVQGNYSDIVTTAGTTCQIISGLFNPIDIVADVRDVIQVFSNESTFKDKSLALIGIVPVIGATKNIDEVMDVIKIKNKTKVGDAVTGGSKVAAIPTTVAVKVVKQIDPAKGFESFDEFKKVYGKAPEGWQWHHIVEQCTEVKCNFNPKLIHNPDNLVLLPAEKHLKEISAYYSTKDRSLSLDLTVRQWLRQQSFEKQYERGIQVLKNASVIIE